MKEKEEVKIITNHRLANGGGNETLENMNDETF